MISVGSRLVLAAGPRISGRGHQQSPRPSRNELPHRPDGRAEPRLSTGLASIANGQALTRTNTAAHSRGSERPEPAESGTTIAQPRVARSAPATSRPRPAAAGDRHRHGAAHERHVAFGLGFLTRGTFTVSDGTFTTTYQATGTDTVGDLISAINSGPPGNALVHAWLNGSGDLVITSQNKNDTVTVGGDYAAALGFGSRQSAHSSPPPASTPAVRPAASDRRSSTHERHRRRARQRPPRDREFGPALQTGGTANCCSPAASRQHLNIFA